MSSDPDNTKVTAAAIDLSISLSSDSEESDGADDDLDSKARSRRKRRVADVYKPTWIDGDADQLPFGTLDHRHSQLLMTTYKWTEEQQTVYRKADSQLGTMRTSNRESAARGKFLHEQFCAAQQYYHVLDTAFPQPPTWFDAIVTSGDFDFTECENLRPPHLLFTRCYVVSAHISECVIRDSSVKNHSTLRVLQQISQSQLTWKRHSSRGKYPYCDAAKFACSTEEIPDSYYECEPIFVILHGAGHYSVLVTVDGYKWHHYDSLRSAPHGQLADLFVQKLDAARARYSRAATAKLTKVSSDSVQAKCASLISSLPDPFREHVFGQPKERALVRSCASVVRQQYAIQRELGDPTLYVATQLPLQNDSVSCLLFVHVFIDYFIFTRGCYYPAFHSSHILLAGSVVLAMRDFIVSSHVNITDYENYLNEQERLEHNAKQTKLS